MKSCFLNHILRTLTRNNRLKTIFRKHGSSQGEAKQNQLQMKERGNRELQETKRKIITGWNITASGRLAVMNDLSKRHSREAVETLTTC